MNVNHAPHAKKKSMKTFVVNARESIYLDLETGCFVVTAGNGSTKIALRGAFSTEINVRIARQVFPPVNFSYIDTYSIL